MKANLKVVIIGGSNTLFYPIIIQYIDYFLSDHSLFCLMESNKKTNRILRNLTLTIGSQSKFAMKGLVSLIFSLRMTACCSRRVVHLRFVLWKRFSTPFAWPQRWKWIFKNLNSSPRRTFQEPRFANLRILLSSGCSATHTTLVCISVSPFSLVGSKNENFAYIIDKVHKKSAAWKGKLLSRAGRVTLAKSILSSMPIYTMSNLWILQGMCDQLDATYRQFIWGGKHCHWVNRSKVCQPGKRGGLGLREYRHVNTSMVGKHAWKLIIDTDKLWVKLLSSNTLLSSIYLMLTPTLEHHIPGNL